MSWQQHHQRMGVMDSVLGEMTRRQEPVIPPGRQPEIGAVFGDEGNFLQALHYRWVNALTARLDTVLESGDAEVTTAADRVWNELAAERPTLRAVLATYSAHPALVAAIEREQHSLGWTGLNFSVLSSRPAARPRPVPAA